MVSLCPFLGKNGGVVGVASKHHFSKFSPKSQIDVNTGYQVINPYLAKLGWELFCELHKQKSHQIQEGLFMFRFFPTIPKICHKQQKVSRQETPNSIHSHEMKLTTAFYPCRKNPKCSTHCLGNLSLVHPFPSNVVGSPWVGFLRLGYPEPLKKITQSWWWLLIS